MSETFEYVIYDYKRRRSVMDFRAYSDGAAIEEFSAFYREVIGGAKWEHRKVDRYYLVRVDKDGDTPVVMEDWQVRLSFERFFLADPPSNEADLVEIEREFARLDALDVERIARRSNRPRAA